MYRKKINAKDYRDAGNVLLNDSNLNIIQKASLDNFIKNTIREVLGETYIKGGLKLRFLDFAVDSSLSENEFLIKESKNKKSLEVPLRVVANIELNQTNPSSDFPFEPSYINYKTVEFVLTKFPILNSKGTFIINGLEKVMYSHLEAAPKIMLTQNKKNKIIVFKGNESRIDLNLHPENGIEIKLQPDTSRTTGRRKVRYNKTFYIKNLLNLANLDNDTDIIDIINDSIMSNAIINSANLQTEGAEELINYISNFFLHSLERVKINERLSLTTRLLNETLAEEITIGDRTLKEGTKLSIEECELIVKHTNKVKIKTKDGIILTVLSNGFKPITDCIDEKYHELIPDKYYTIKEEIEGSVKKQPILVDSVFLKENLSNDFTDEELRNLLELNYSELKGSYLTPLDLISMCNLYSNFNLGMIKEDDIDSLSNKVVVNIAVVYESLLRNIIKEFLEKISRDHAQKKFQKESKGEYLNINANGVRTITQRLTTSEIVQTEDNVNPLTEVAHRRKISNLQVEGRPGGQNPDTKQAGARNINPSHIGRLCVVETPESKNVGLVNHLATLSRVNEWGFIEAPFFKVNKQLKQIDYKEVIYMDFEEESKFNRALTTNIATEDKVVVEYLDTEGVAVEVEVIPATYMIVNGNWELLNQKAIELKIEKNKKELEKKYKLKLKTKIEKHRKDWFINSVVEGIDSDNKTAMLKPEEVDFVICRGEHLFSTTTASIPFMNHNDAVRNLMGDAMQKQAIPIFGKQIALCGSSLDPVVAKESNSVVVAPFDGIIIDVTNTSITIQSLEKTLDEKGNYVDNIVTIILDKYKPSSEKTLIAHIPIVKPREFVFKNQVIADGLSTENGRNAIGTNLLVGYMSFEGYNYEDSILISERLVKDDVLTSLHVQKLTFMFYPEEEPKPIENSSGNITDKYEASFVKPGTTVKKQSKLGSKIIKIKRNNSIVEEEKMFFYEEDVPGVVVSVEANAGDEKDTIEVAVYIMTIKKIEVGDKLAGRHGNKGVISKIIPECDMPHLEDGTPMDIVLTPLGVPSRMNIGQLIENQLGLVLNMVQKRSIASPMDKLSIAELKRITNKLTDKDGKMYVIDGRTGERLDNPINVGISYILKLKHIVDDKIHARETSRPESYNMYGQPKGGKRRDGGQRIGENEAWALIAHGASATLEEFLTFKSDKVENRLEFNRKGFNPKIEPKEEIPKPSKLFFAMLPSLGSQVNMFNDKTKESEILITKQKSVKPVIKLEEIEPKKETFEAKNTTLSDIKNLFGIDVIESIEDIEIDSKAGDISITEKPTESDNWLTSLTTKKIELDNLDVSNFDETENKKEEIIKILSKTDSIILSVLKKLSMEDYLGDTSRAMKFREDLEGYIELLSSKEEKSESDKLEKVFMEADLIEEEIDENNEINKDSEEVENQEDIDTAEFEPEDSEDIEVIELEDKEVKEMKDLMKELLISELNNLSVETLYTLYQEIQINNPGIELITLDEENELDDYYKELEESNADYTEDMEVSE